MPYISEKSIWEGNAWDKQVRKLCNFILIKNKSMQFSKRNVRVREKVQWLRVLAKQEQGSKFLRPEYT